MLTARASRKGQVGRYIRAWGIGIACALLASVLLGAACQTQTRPVKINGKVYKPKAKEFRDVEEARAAKKRGDLETEKKAWERLLERHPKTAFRRKAMLRLGWIAFRQSRWQAAVDAYGKASPAALGKGSERINALWAYGVSLYKVGQLKDAATTLEDLYPRLDKARQQRARPMLLTAARRTNNVASEIRWLTLQLNELPASEQQKIQTQLREKIDGQLSLPRLYKVYLQRGGAKLAFPYNLMALRLARFYCHVREWSRCRALVRQLLEETPPTEPMVPKVRALQKQLLALQGKVSPRVIGVIYPRSGRGTALGRWVRSAIALVRQKYPNVKIREMDSKSRPEVAARAVDTLVFKHRVIAIFGPVLSNTSTAAALRAQRLGVPLMTISIREGIAGTGSFVFRNNLTLSQMGRAMARYAFQQLGLRRFAVMYPHRLTGQIQASAFWKEVERLGGRMVGAESYDTGTTDFTAAAKRLVGRHHLTQRPLWYKLYRQIRHVRERVQKRRLYKKLVKQFLPVTDFDAIFLPVEHPMQVASVVSSLAQQDIEVKLHYDYWEKQRRELYRRRKRPLKFIQLLGTNIWKNDRIFSLEPRNVVGSIFCVRYFAESKKQIVRSFVREFQRSFPGLARNREPIHVSAYTYDSMNLLLHIAGQKNPPASRDAFRQALNKVEHFPGVTGEMSVQPNGEVLAPITYLVAHRKQFFDVRYVAKELIP